MLNKQQLSQKKGTNRSEVPEEKLKKIKKEGVIPYLTRIIGIL